MYSSQYFYRFLTWSCLLYLFSCQSDEPDLIQESLFEEECPVPSEYPPQCPPPWLPGFQHIHQGADLSPTQTRDAELFVGYSQDLTALEPDQWEKDTSLSFEDLGSVRVFARFAASEECEEMTLSRVYQVVNEYWSPAREPNSRAIDRMDSHFIDWVSSVIDVQFGEEVNPSYQVTEKALGPATGEIMNVLVLGEGGNATLTFSSPISNGPGPDFAIFENAFNDFFLELAFVEISSNGEDFLRFPNAYLGQKNINTYEGHNSENIMGMAGTYRAGYGVPFDLQVFDAHPEVITGQVDLTSITQIRLIDIIGDGQTQDSFGQAIYDPYPNSITAGFDLDGIGVFYNQEINPCDLPSSAEVDP
jgi:hypothetical protein